MVERVECGPDTSAHAVRRVAPWGFNSDVIRTTRGNTVVRFELFEFFNHWRVCSWLRTNAGGVPNTCKSYGTGGNSGSVADGCVTREHTDRQWATASPTAGYYRIP